MLFNLKFFSCVEKKLEKLRRNVLESVILLGTCSEKEDGAKILISESYFDLMLKVLHDPNAGDQLQEQITFTLRKAVKHELVGCYLLTNTTVPKDLQAFLGSASAKVSEIIYELLDKLAVIQKF